MKIIAVSDSHGNAAAIQNVILKHRDADVVAFCGDGSDDIRQIRSMYPDKMIIAVRGNCDWFCDYPYTQDITLCGKKIMITHGHLFGVKEGYHRIINYAQSNGIDIVIFGHTHSQMCSIEGKTVIVNPGSVHYGDFHSLIEIDEDTGKISVTEYPSNRFGTLTL